MTLISFATYGTDRIEFVTDSASYTKRVSSMGRCTKHLTIPHLDAAVLTQGDSAFGDAAKFAMLVISRDVATFDQLVDHAPELLCELHAAEAPKDDRSIVYLLGWSERDGKWRAYEMTSENHFEPTKTLGLYAIPSPWRIRPSATELGRFRHFMSDRDDLEKLAAAWQSWPAQPAPRTTQEWIDLAQDVREQRALNGFFQTIVAGDVFHTVLRRGSVETRKIHTFNDTGEEFATLVERTEHPIGLAGPCWCESGKNFGDCHAGEVECGCGSGKPFGGCCQSSREHGLGLPNAGAGA